MKYTGSIIFDASGVVEVRQTFAIPVATNCSPYSGKNKFVFGFPKSMKVEKVNIRAVRRRLS